MTDLSLSDIEALLSRLEPVQVEGFVPVRALKQLAATMRERDALKASLEMCVKALCRGGDFPETTVQAMEVLASLESGELVKS